MKIALTGASGFLASNLKEKLFGGKAEFLILNRDQNDDAWEKIILNSDVVINLAGAPVIQRWTEKNKQIIFDSRIRTTRRLVNILNQLQANQGPSLFISGSAIGIYPDTGEQVHDEFRNFTGNNILTEVVDAWESEARELTNQNIRLVITRIGVVLGIGGGLLKKTLPLFKLGLGGRIASGEQAISFISIDDLVNAFRFFIENENTQGIYNLVAPHWVSNSAFTKEMGNQLNRPVLFPVPAFVLKMIYGKAADIMINGEKVFPKHLLDEGFIFKFPSIDSALKKIL